MSRTELIVVYAFKYFTKKKTSINDHRIIFQQLIQINLNFDVRNFQIVLYAVINII